VSLRNGISSLECWFETLVHPSVKADRVIRARHRSFISSHFLAGLLALCIIPVYLAVFGPPDLVEALAFAWFVSPVGIAVLLSKTGRYETAHTISAVNLTGLVAFAATLTGGLSSFLIAWMLVVPIEAALSASKRVIIIAMTCAIAALFGLWGAEFFAILPAPRQLGLSDGMLLALGTGSAIAYAGGVALSVHNIHKESEQSVRDSERRYRLMSENATDLITRHRPNGHVLFASLGAERLAGCSAEALMGEGYFDRILVADRPAFLTAIARAARGAGETSVEFRLNGNDKDDVDREVGYFWAEMRCRKIRYEGQDDEIVAVTRDISQRKAQEMALMESREEAERASLAKTHFLANMSHELRTPLNAIIGFSEILTDSTGGVDEAARNQEYASLIHESGRHLLNVVNDILDMSRIETGKFEIFTEHFDPRPTIDVCCQIVMPQLMSARLEIVQNIEPDLPEIVADERACKQILLNLLSNAIKFSEPGGKIFVEASIIGGSMVMAVSDTGVGISEHDLSRIGNPFVQADAAYNRKHEGTGLGLSVVKGLVALHGGTMSIDSQEGIGTTVKVRLPVNGAEEADMDIATAGFPERILKSA
jgi:two-component system, cell cycle sensor histidine kinase DivJ